MNTVKLSAAPSPSKKTVVQKTFLMKRTTPWAELRFMAS